MGKGSARPATGSREAGWTTPIPEAFEPETRPGDFGWWATGQHGMRNAECAGFGCDERPGWALPATGQRSAPYGRRRVQAAREADLQHVDMRPLKWPSVAQRPSSVQRSGAHIADHPHRTTWPTQRTIRSRSSCWSCREGSARRLPTAAVAASTRRASATCRGVHGRDFRRDRRLPEVIAGRYHATELAPRPMESP